MRDDQVRRYARHILLPEVGGLGQRALLNASARVDLGEPAGAIAAAFLAAGGVGTLVAPGDPAPRGEVAAHGPDTRVLAAGEAAPLALPPAPAWWPAAPGDAAALAYWRGSSAAMHWMAEVIARR